mmetsp:Transcript_6051/g.6756  ORF Transcript_6051/g.6756 Transcript_6051/m.6756 type:complete len:90 (-) Transcript_6051:384-653(-)
MQGTPRLTYTGPFDMPTSAEHVNCDWRLKYKWACSNVCGINLRHPVLSSRDCIASRILLISTSSKAFGWKTYGMYTLPLEFLPFHVRSC